MANSPADELLDAVGTTPNAPDTDNSGSDPASQLLQAIQKPDKESEQAANNASVPGNTFLQKFLEGQRQIGEGMVKGVKPAINALNTYEIDPAAQYLAKKIGDSDFGGSLPTAAEAHNNLLAKNALQAQDYSNQPRGIQIGEDIGKGATETALVAPQIAALAPAVEAIPGVGPYLTGTANNNLLSKVASRGIAGIGTTAGFNALTGHPNTPTGLALGGVLGIGAGAIGDKIAEEVVDEAPAMTSQDVKAIAGAKYQEAADKGGILNGDFTNKMQNFIESQKNSTALGLATGKTDPANELAEIFKPFAGQPINLQSLQEFDENLGNDITNSMKDGRMTPQSLKLTEIQKGVRNLVNSAEPEDLIEGSTKEGFDALADARKTYAGYTKLRDLENIQERAALAQGSPTTAAKNAYKNLYLSAKKSRGYSSDELDLIKKASQTGLATDALNLVGSRLIPIASGATGGIPGAVGGYAASEAARAMAGRLQAARGQAVMNKVLENTLGNKLTAPTQSTVTPYINHLMQATLPSLGASAVGSSQSAP